MQHKPACNGDIHNSEFSFAPFIYGDLVQIAETEGHQGWSRGADLASVAQELEHEGGGEGLEILRLGQLRQERLRGGDVQAHASRPGG